MSNCKSMGKSSICVERTVYHVGKKLLCFCIIRFSKIKLQMEFIYIYICEWIKNIILSGKGLSANEPVSQTMSKFNSVQLLCRAWLFATPWTAACQASLSITNSQSLPKLISIESVIPSNHLILWHPLLLPPSIFPSIRVFSSECSSHQVAKVLEYQVQHQFFQWIFRTDFL